MRVAYVSTEDPTDVHAWSGMPFYMSRALRRQGLAVELLGPLVARQSLVLRGKRFLYRRLLGQDHHVRFEPRTLNAYARQITAKLAGRPVDVVLGLGSTPIAALECNQPIVCWTDATFALLHEFYPEFSHLTRETIRKAHAMERASLGRCQLLIFSSDWAAESAVRDYGVDPRRVRIVPLGANIEEEYTPAEIAARVASRSRQTCELIFFAGDWYRKGGAMAVAVARALNNAGLDTRLTLIGARPPAGEVLPPFVEHIPFIAKATPAGRCRIDALMSRSHFLIQHSLADCSPLALCEANARGVPCLTTNVGGIPTTVRDGLNGITFPVEADADAYAARVLDLFTDPDRYRELALSSFNEYATRLNWSASTRRVKELLEEFV